MMKKATNFMYVYLGIEKNRTKKKKKGNEKDRKKAVSFRFGY